MRTGIRDTVSRPCERVRRLWNKKRHANAHLYIFLCTTLWNLTLFFRKIGEDNANRKGWKNIGAFYVFRVRFVILSRREYKFHVIRQRHSCLFLLSRKYRCSFRKPCIESASAARWLSSVVSHYGSRTFFASIWTHPTV